MAGDDREFGQQRGQGAVEEADVAVSEAGGAHVDDDLSGSRLRVVTFDQLQRLVGPTGQITLLRARSLRYLPPE
jgi:hypothetical protein